MCSLHRLVHSVLHNTKSPFSEEETTSIFLNVEQILDIHMVCASLYQVKLLIRLESIEKIGFGISIMELFRKFCPLLSGNMSKTLVVTSMNVAYAPNQTFSYVDYCKDNEKALTLYNNLATTRKSVQSFQTVCVSCSTISFHFFLCCPPFEALWHFVFPTSTTTGSNNPNTHTHTHPENQNNVNLHQNLTISLSSRAL